ncbi:MAG: HD domain-containing protein [Lachnospiraceae bacterium]|nr:HD domain-containing protein [Lachnospiraceae bacterium]
MIRKKIDELVGNEVVGKPVMTWDYQIILPEGAVIRPDYIQKMKELGVIDVWVIDQISTETNESVILKENVKSSVKQKVKDILERHTYHKNDELLELSVAAEDIVSNILEEEKVVEQIFDIRQRSADLYEHSVSVCSMAILTALKLKLSKDKITAIGVGCLLHDIGLRYETISFNDVDMETLYPKEIAEYKKHPVYGYNALKNESWLSQISLSIILFHHERLDGSGYPIKTRDISQECGIVAVCDAFDEMICGIGCKRTKVYEAIEYLKNFKNSKFDGKIVDTFLSFTAVYPTGTHVITNEGEVGVVVSQNKEFQDRPVIRIIRDKNGEELTEEVIKDLVKVHNIFIDKVLD